MNASIGLGMLNNTLRIAMYCGAFNMWFEPDLSGIELPGMVSLLGILLTLDPGSGFNMRF